MSQHDYVIANSTGAAVRADINSALQAIVTNNSGPAEPIATYAYMFWPDTTTGKLKMRNGANTAWIEIGSLETANLGYLTSYFAAGTKLVFYQSAPPAGWTKDTSSNDKALRVVSGVGGGTGGTHDLSSPPSTAHVHTGPSHTHTGPSHVHGVSVSVTMSVSLSIAGAAYQRGLWFSGGQTGVGSVSEDGHGHPGSSGSGSGIGSGSTGAGGTEVTGAGGTGNTGSTAPTAFAPKYIDVIVAIKD